MKADTLSDVLRNVRLTGAIFFDVEASSPWVAEAPPATSLAPLVLPGSEYVIEYHVVLRGNPWAAMVNSGEEPIRLAPGSIIMFPQGDPHVLSSRPGMRAQTDYRIFDQPAELAPPYYIRNLGGGSETTRLLCGFLGCDLLPFNPIIQSLPPMIHVANGYTAENGWLRSLINRIGKESETRRVGSGSILARLSELMFIEVLRSYIETLPENATGWLAALADRQIGQAIQLMHGDPKRPWTLDMLAREVGVSRTVLVSRFSGQLGVPPITYLSNWRMQLAAGKLSRGGANIAKIAAEVGYESEAAFSRSFKRSTGMSPGMWRAKFTE